jgi:hypothetical protein
MIEPEILRKLGWSEDLIQAALEVAKQIKPEIQVSGDTAIYLTDTTVIESSTTDLSNDPTPSSIWPHF